MQNLQQKKYTDIVIISGRYEGIDARVKKIFKTEDISVGPFVLTGGELPAMIIIDCISRQVKGRARRFNSLEESRIASRDVYTRPKFLNIKKRSIGCRKSSFQAIMLRLINGGQRKCLLHLSKSQLDDIIKSVVLTTRCNVWVNHHSKELPVDGHFSFCLHLCHLLAICLLVAVGWG
jgi:hypothetical protein